MIAVFTVIGLACVLLEFFMPGIVMGVIGSVFLLSSLYMLYVQGSSLISICLYSLGLIVAIGLMVRWILRRFQKGKILHRSDQEGFQACQFPKESIGKQAIAASDLKPSGLIELDGKVIEALSSLGYIDKGTTVRIVGGQGSHLIVTQEKNHANCSSD